MNPIVGAVQLRIPLDTPVLHLLELLRQRVAYGESAAAVRHVVRKMYVLQMALRRGPDVVELIVIVLPQNSDEIIGDEDGVVVAHNEPPHALHPQPQRLRHDSRDPDRRAVALGVFVPETRGVLGDLQWRQEKSVVVFLGFHALVNPNDASHFLRPPPQLDVVFPPVPELRRSSDSEDDVREAGFFLLGRRDFLGKENLGLAVDCEGFGVGVVGEVVGDESEGTGEEGEED
ncbi:hypothetical protein TIFTF001_046917 [Ficus carica]|uniref:Uncharacterized protein n=1 Tax=Ficus carica TaxID=3494 RepID=A0AA87Z5F2_FICCA|nr:hypothetical protein TIFTF001_046917 [Ficus carica]